MPENFYGTKTDNVLRAFRFTKHEKEKLAYEHGHLSAPEDLLLEDPYAAVRILPSYSLRRCDAAVVRANLSPHPLLRACGEVWEALRSYGEREGHTFCYWDELRMKLPPPSGGEDKTAAAMERLVDIGACERKETDNGQIVADARIYKMEQELACWLAEAETDDVGMWQLGEEAENLSDIQEKAAEKALRSRVSVLTGPAGSGKSYVIAALNRTLKRQGANVLLCGPTGKAARRVEELSGSQASTIHKLLGYDGISFRAGRNEKLTADFLIADETSMIDTELAYRLFAALDLTEIQVLLVGDPNQLPPVGCGDPLRDVLKYSRLTRTHLPSVVRQAGDLKRNSTAILDGKVAAGAAEKNGERPVWQVRARGTSEEMEATILGLYENELESWGYDIFSDVQLLIPRKTSTMGCAHMNHSLQRLFQRKLYGRELPASGGGDLVEGDKIIQTRNNYRIGKGVMNGTQGKVLSVSDSTATVLFDSEESPVLLDGSNLRDIQLAYALTVHKSQGSEFPCVVLLLHPAHKWKLHHRNLFYTAVTRASRTCVIVGQEAAIASCAATVTSEARRTSLSSFLHRSLQPS